MILAPVDEVRFYRNSAVVRRKATVSLQAGSTALLLSGISVSADPTSLRLFFSADVTGSDVQILPLREVLDRLPSAELDGEITELQDRLRILQTSEELWIANGNFTNRGDWSEERIAGYLEALPSHIRQLQTERRALEQQLAALQRKQEALKKKEEFLAVRLTLSCPEACESAVIMEYSERLASWSSVYEVHTSTDSTELRVISRARMVQNTDEVWENVRIFLYTGNPAESKALPELRKLSLQLADPRRPLPPQVGHSVPRPNTAILYPSTPAPSSAGKDDSCFPAPPKQMVMQEAETADAETMTGFLLSGRRTVSSGSVGTMADLKTETIRAEKRIICVPKLDSSAYLAAVIKTADWPLKPAPAKIYLDQNYCGEVLAASDPDKEEFLLSLGRDERISLRREAVRTKTEPVPIKGLIRNSFEFAIRVSNLSDRPQQVELWDQIPVSTEKLLVVDRTAAVGAFFDEETGKLRWTLTVDPMSTVEKRLSYSVSHPKDQTVQADQLFDSSSLIRPGMYYGPKRCPSCRAIVSGKTCPICGGAL